MGRVRGCAHAHPSDPKLALYSLRRFLYRDMAPIMETLHAFMAAIKLRDRHKCRVSFHHRLGDSLSGDDMKGRAARK